MNKSYTKMSDYFRQKATISSFLSINSWIIVGEIEQRIKDKIEKFGTPLKEWKVKINYGIKTGFNDAFIINGEKRKELIEQDPKSDEIIRPILRGRDIKKYKYEFANLWLIYIPWHFPLHKNQNAKIDFNESEEVFKKSYPAIYKHLLRYYNQLSNRNKSETGIRYEWYALQRWGANYWEDFSKPKIIFQEMVQESSFILDSNGEFICLDTARIITGEDLEILLTILNSKLFFYSVKSFYGGGGLGEMGVRMKHTFFENFPAPIYSENQKIIIKNLLNNPTDENLNKIEKIIYDFYKFEKTEIDFIESQ